MYIITKMSFLWLENMIKGRTDPVIIHQNVTFFIQIRLFSRKLLQTFVSNVFIYLYPLWTIIFPCPLIGRWTEGRWNRLRACVRAIMRATVAFLVISICQKVLGGFSSTKVYWIYLSK